MFEIMIVIFTLLLLCLRFFQKENFNYGKSFGQYIAPQKCTPENNCFPGAYFRTQAYQNVCDPDYGALTRDKIQLQSDCLRTLGNYPPHKKRFHCYVDKHLNRHCSWV